MSWPAMNKQGGTASKFDRKLEKVARALAQGRFAEVIDEAGGLLKQKPGDVRLHLLLGDAALRAQQFELAVGAYQRALGLRQGSAPVYANLACALSELGRALEAEAMFERALELEPSNLSNLNNMGSHCYRQRRLDAAREWYAKALAIDPENVEALIGMGAVSFELEQSDEASSWLDFALQRNSGNPVALRRLTLFHYEGRRAKEAFDCLTKLQPALTVADVPLLKKLANLLAYLHEYPKAIQCCDWLADLTEGDAETYLFLGGVFAILNMPSESNICLLQTLEAEPKNTVLLSRVLHNHGLLCDWQAMKDIQDRLFALAGEQGEIRAMPFALLSVFGVPAEQLRNVAAQFAKGMVPESASPLAPVHRKRDGRLRIGYMSADFRQHAVTYLIVGVLEAHDREKVEVYGYSYGMKSSAGAGGRVERAVDVFRDLKDVMVDQIAKTIHDDAIDILVDLTGWTEGSRAELLAYRPAPVQVSWLGYPGTLGGEQLADYLIGDPVVTPLSMASGYAEKIAQMPNCYMPNDRLRPVGEAPSRASQGLPSEGLVFCSLNQPYKFNAETFDLWRDILCAVPDSVLWLSKPASELAVENLRREFTQRGLAVERLVFAERMPSITEHLGRIQLADIALDTFPYNSHTTGSDALWVGVPLITLMGEAFQSRVAASLLHAVGLPELIAESPESYCRIAIELAQDADRLKRLRKHLNDVRMASPLFDTERFARDLENLYRRMWQAHEAGDVAHIVA